MKEVTWKLLWCHLKWIVKQLLECVDRAQVRHHAETVPVVLVGTKVDLRTDESTINALKVGKLGCGHFWSDTTD